MKILRIVLYVSIACTFCWLTWWVLPNIAFVSLEEKDRSIPDTGLVILGYDHSKITGLRVINNIDFGWSAFIAGWPCLLGGALVGLGGGYVLGDRTRRIIAVDSASEHAIQTVKEYETSATLKLAYCKAKEQKLNDGFKKFAAGNDTLARERMEFYIEKDQAEIKKKNHDTSELNKAKSVIQRLEKKIDRLKEKTID